MHVKDIENGERATGKRRGEVAQTTQVTRGEEQARKTGNTRVSTQDGALETGPVARSGHQTPGLPTLFPAGSLAASRRALRVVHAAVYATGLCVLLRLLFCPLTIYLLLNSSSQAGSMTLYEPREADRPTDVPLQNTCDCRCSARTSPITIPSQPDPATVSSRPDSAWPAQPERSRVSTVA